MEEPVSVHLRFPAHSHIPGLTHSHRPGSLAIDKTDRRPDSVETVFSARPEHQLNTCHADLTEPGNGLSDLGRRPVIGMPRPVASAL